MNAAFEYKNIGAEVKDIDESKGIVTGYFAAFGNVDFDSDMIMPGAFKKTLQEKAIKVKHLWQHDTRYPLSSPTILKEDTHGLYFESQISKTSYGKDVIQLYKDGVIDNHSIGFKTEKKADRKSYREIQEVRLFEGSTVTFGANNNTPFMGMKSLTKEDAFSRFDKVLKAMRNGKYENEEIFDLLEIEFQQIKQYIIDISDNATKPDDESTLPESEIIDVFTTFTKSLKI